MRVSSLPSLASVLVLVLVLAGCTAEEAPARVEASTSPSPTSTQTPTGPDLESLRQRCGFAIEGRTVAIPGPDAATTLVAAEVGSGPDVAVLLHQVGASGLCGWVPWAEWAARQGVRLVLVDACGYGESVCSEAAEDDEAGWVGSAVDWARERGARRVTLIGASMGGSIAAAVAPDVEVDAVVDLSGPVRWQGVASLVRAAPRLDLPFLAAASDADDGADPGALRRAAARAPGEPSRYVAAPDGHGWSMLTEGFSSRPADTRPTRLGRLVVRWVRGDTG